jgi:hypothetical protein
VYGAGWVPIKPTSVTGGGTNTINADGSVTLTNSTNTVFNGVFTSAYRNYKAIFTASTASNFPNQFYLRLCSGGTANFTTNYSYTSAYVQSGTLSITSNASGQNVAVLAFAQDMEMTFYCPQVARTTSVFFSSSYAATNIWGNNFFGAATQFDGFQFFNNTASGVMRIYGLL